MNAENSQDLIDLSSKPESYYSQDRKEMLKYVPENSKRILDVGCGDGTFGVLIKEKTNVEIWGIEINNAAAALAKKRIDRILVGDVAELIDRLPDLSFDCAIFNDILEHLIDPFNILMKIKKKLTPNGVVVCSLPNIRYFYVLKDLVLKREWDYKNSGVLDKTHLRFFTKKSITFMFSELGYDVLELEGINGIATNKFELFNVFTFGFFSDARYLQFACVAKPIK